MLMLTYAMMSEPAYQAVLELFRWKNFMKVFNGGEQNLFAEYPPLV